eukprot:jgi/Tetstr1/423343/TSEL_014039.t1
MSDHAKGSLAFFTANPWLPVEQREGVPHHLIDILPPDAEFSAGDFYDRGRQAREDILKRAVLQRGKVPLVVGGTSFYLQWFIYGKADTPKSTPQGEAAARAWLDAECAALAGELGRECTRDEVFDCGVAMVRGAGPDEMAACRSVVFFSRQLPQLRRAVVRGCRRQATVASSAGTTPSEKARVVVLTGPTGVGKTAASLRLARALGAEIISADSVQVFASLDIGSDKLPVEQREGVPHHLIDILPPDAEFSAGDFYDRGRQAVEDILKRGKVPLVVGGTSFYLQWFIYGKADTPKSTPQGEAAARAWLDTECAALAGELGRECTRDEIIRVTGAPLPRLEADPSKLDYDFRCFFLHRPRIELCRRIDVRVEEMVVNGILAEAQALLDAGVVPNSCSAARSIGYRQALDFLTDDALDWADEETLVSALQQMVKDTQTATRQMAKQQMTWFRDNSLFKWLEADDARGGEDVVAAILKYLQDPQHKGGSGSYGRLTKQEQDLQKRYVAKLLLLDDRRVCLDVIRQTRVQRQQHLRSA